MISTVTIFTGTNKIQGSKLIKRKFPDFSSWSDNLETLAHHYEGMAVQITIELDSEKEQVYIREPQDLVLPASEYTYGFAEMECPKGAIWYSFGGPYLDYHVIEVKEIFPDLNAFNEE